MGNWELSESTPSHAFTGAATAGVKKAAGKKVKKIPGAKAKARANGAHQANEATNAFFKNGFTKKKNMGKKPKFE